MKPSNQHQLNIEKTKQKRNRSRSEPKTYRNYFGYRNSLPGAFYGSIKNASQARKASIQRKQSSDGDSSIKNDASSSRSRQLKSTKQNKNALRKAETQKFTSLISSLNELLSKTLLPLDLYQQLTQQLNEINQNGLDTLKQKTNENENQNENSDLFAESWNNFITVFQKFLSDSTKNQLITFFSSHVDSIQNVMNNVADYPPSNSNFIPQWSSLLLQYNSDLKNMNTCISNFKKQNNNDIKNNMNDFSNLLKNFQLKLNDTKLFKLSSFSMSKRDESHFTVSKITIRMIKYAEELSRDQFSNGLESSLAVATEKINSLIPQFSQIFSSQNTESKTRKSLKKLNKNTKSSSSNRARASLQKNNSVKSSNKATKVNNVKNSDKSSINSGNQNKNKKINNNQNNDAEIDSNNTNDNDSINSKNIDENVDNEYNENVNSQNSNEIEEEEDYNDNSEDIENKSANPDDEDDINNDSNENDEDNDEDINENVNENENNDDDENEPSVNFQLKTAKKYNKIFKKKLNDVLKEEKDLNDEINEKTASLESSRKTLRNLKLTRNQLDAVQRRSDALKTKAFLEKQLDSLRSEVTKLEERLRSKKDEHDQFLVVKKDLEDAQIENEYIKTVKKINTKYLRRLNSAPPVKNSANSNSNPVVCVSETASSLLAPASISTTTQTNQSSSTFDQSVVDAVKKLQDELETVKTEYDKLIKERTTAGNNDNGENNDDSSNLSLLRIYYDAQRFQQQSQTLKNELQAAQLRSISIAKETEIDSYFKSILQTKKRQLKELEKISNNLKTGPNISAKSSSSTLSATSSSSSSQIQRRNSQSSPVLPSSFFDRSILQGRGDFDPMDATLSERSRLQQEYHRLKPGPQEETKKRRISIKKQLAKIPSFADEYVKLDEACESLMFSRSKLKNAFDSNTAAIDALNDAILMKEETEMAEMIARRRLEQLHIEFPLDLAVEKKSKKKYEEEEERKRKEIEAEKRRRQEEEEEEEEEKNEEEEEEEEEEEDKNEYNFTDDENENKKKKIVKQKQNSNKNTNEKEKTGFKIKFNFDSFGSKNNKNKNKNKNNEAAKKESSKSNLADMNKNTENEEEEKKKEENENKNDSDNKEEEEEEEESNIGDEYIPNLIRLRQVNNERIEMEEKLRAIEEIFSTLFGERIPPNVTLNLTDKIELVMRQFNKTE